MTMDLKAVKLELKLIHSKISKRISIGEGLARSAWNPMFIELPPGRRALIISPHPDDDAIGMGGTIIKMLESGAKVRVVNLSLPLKDGPSYKDREKEALLALQIMGVEDYMLPDGEFPEEGLLRDIMVKEIREFSPDLVFIPSPMENNIQHLATFSAYVDALKLVGDVATAMYEVWGMVVPNMIVDITAQSQRKAQAIAAHTSQIHKVDYVAMAKGLNQYRAISCGGSGQAEAFLFLERKDLLKQFGGN